MLTSKQESFAQAIVDGFPQVDAYKRAYNSENMDPSTVYQEASRVANNRKVAARVEELREAVAVMVVEKRAWDLDRLVDEAETNMAGAREDRQWSAANGALTTIGKATGLITDKVDVNVTHTLKPGLSLEELEERLQRLDALDAGVVDGTSEVVE